MPTIKHHLLLLNALLATVVTAANISDYITPCKAKDTDLNECVRVAAQKIFMMAGHGIPELGIRALDPVTVPNLAIKQTGAMTMSMEFINSTHYGLGAIKVKKASVDPQHHMYNFTILIPRYTIAGEYNIDGKILLLPIKGHGKSNATFIDLEALWQFVGKPEINKDGQEVLTFNTLKTTILPHSPKDVKVYFDGLFGGNKALGDTMNQFLNSNWHEIFKQLKPRVAATFDSRMLPVANKFISQFPLDDLYAHT